VSADVLREAARLMRNRAEAAEALSFLSPLDMAGYSCDGGWITAQDEVIAEHYAPLSPAVALAVADWLEDEADRIPAHATHALTSGGMEISIDAAPAVLVARAYLGT
jgi:hypothetical protein